MSEKLPIQLGRGTAYENGALFPEDMTVSEWMRDGAELYRIHRKHQFSLGDWLNFGSRKYGEKYRVACEEMRMEYQTLRNWASVCNKIEMSRRRDNLDFSHHAEVAALDAKEQNKWLNWAEAGGKSVGELREAIRTSLGEYSGEDHGRPVKTFTGYLTNAIRLIGQQSDQVQTWSNEQRFRTKELLRPIVEFYQKL